MSTYLQALPHDTSLLGASQTAELNHIVTEHALAAICPLASFTFLASKT